MGMAALHKKQVNHQRLQYNSVENNHTAKLFERADRMKDNLSYQHCVAATNDPNWERRGLGRSMPALCV